jgi:hypothetical protein
LRSASPVLRWNSSELPTPGGTPGIRSGSASGALGLLRLDARACATSHHGRSTASATIVLVALLLIFGSQFSLSIRRRYAPRGQRWRRFS